MSIANRLHILHNLPAEAPVACEVSWRGSEESQMAVVTLDGN